MTASSTPVDASKSPSVVPSFSLSKPFAKTDEQQSQPSSMQTSTSDSTSQSSPSPSLPPIPTAAASTLTNVRLTIAQPVVASFMAGGVAGAVSRTVVSPLERLKILFQIQSQGRNEYKMSVGKALGKMWKEEGWRGFMRGNGTNCIRIVPYSAVQFGSYNFYKGVRAEPAISLQIVCAD